MNGSMILIKRLPLIENCTLETTDVAIDDDLTNLAIYDISSHKIYFLTTIMMMHYICQYQKKLVQDREYSLKASLPFHKAIKANHLSSVFKMMFMKANEKQFLIVLYYNGLLQLYESKRNWNIVTAVTTDTYLADAALCGNTLYTVSYGSEVRAYDILENCRYRSVQTKAKRVLADTDKGLLYENISGNVLADKETLIPARNNNKKSVQFSVQPHFSISFCKKYLIRKQPSEIYSIDKSKITRIRSIRQANTISISPFNYTIGKILAFASEKDIWIEGLSQNNILIRIKNMKHNVQKLIWCGPYTLLCIDDEDKLWFIQVFSQKMQIKE